eukprot:CAMPEP_0198680684 /NCGR_PEP_ID=MMETSP1468-20131203/5321_1 /TAXON_ID=1461545 /ORGANISM="Mantoniella sp, Strain CCMP1436" /LENGTH=254 /DNA_ID=CAMNT_0044421319 /DNA_START=687 /DNA_END=1447 /DNA_ORIENTATION=+
MSATTAPLAVEDGDRAGRRDDDGVATRGVQGDSVGVFAEARDGVRQVDAVDLDVVAVDVQELIRGHVHGLGDIKFFRDPSSSDRGGGALDDGDPGGLHVGLLSALHDEHGEAGDGADGEEEDGEEHEDKLGQPLDLIFALRVQLGAARELDVRDGTATIEVKYLHAGLDSFGKGADGDLTFGGSLLEHGIILEHLCEFIEPEFSVSVLIDAVQGGGSDAGKAEIYIAPCPGKGAGATDETILATRGRRGGLEAT